MIDYKEYDPPEKPVVKKRTAAFFETAGNKWKYLLLLGVILTLSAAPAITLRYLTVVNEVHMNEEAAAGNITELEAAQSVNGLMNIGYLASLALCLLIALAAAGGAKYVKNTAWKEPYPFKSDFGEGVKENFLHFAPCFLMNVLLLWLCAFVRRSNPDFNFWYYVPTIGWAIIALPASLWFLAATTVYKEKFFKKLAVCLKLCFATLPQTLAMTALAVWPLALTLIPSVWVQIAIPAAYTLLYLPFAMLGWTYFTNKIFDKRINGTAFPQLVDKGLTE